MMWAGVVKLVLQPRAVEAEVDRIGPVAFANGADVRAGRAGRNEELVVERKRRAVLDALRRIANDGNDTRAEGVGFRVRHPGEVEEGRQEIEMIVKRVRLDRLGKELWVVHDQGDVDHLLVSRVGLLAHPVRQAGFAVIGEAQDDGRVREPRLLQRVEHFGDVLVDHCMQVGVEIDVVDLSPGAAQGRELVVSVAGDLLNLWLGRKIVGVVFRQFDAETGEVLPSVAGLFPGRDLAAVAGEGADIVRIDQRHEQAERPVAATRPALQEFDHALAADPRGLPVVGTVRPRYEPAVVVGGAAAERPQAVELAELVRLPFLDRIAGVGRIQPDQPQFVCIASMSCGPQSSPPLPIAAFEAKLRCHLPFHTTS